MHKAIKKWTAPQRSVLVVDDNPTIRSRIRQLFLSEGFGQCIEAGNGREAVGLAIDCDPDIIILDLAMPIMSGIEAAPELRKLLPRVPIILFSLHAEYLKTLDLASLGITAALSKTDSLEELLLKAHELTGD